MKLRIKLPHAVKYSLIIGDSKKFNIKINYRSSGHNIWISIYSGCYLTGYNAVGEDISLKNMSIRNYSE